MQVDTGKLQLLTAAAILVLISGGIAAYAQNQNPNAQSSSSSSSTSSTSSSQSSSGAAASTSTATTPLCTPPAPAGQAGRLVLPISPGQSQTGTIVFADSKGCNASITTAGGIFNVNIALHFAKPVTQYNVVLVANGTSYTLGNMVTGPEGSGQMMNQVLLKAGTYTVSIQIFDTSTTPGQSVLVMQSAQGTVISGAFPTAQNHQGQAPGQEKSDGEKGS